MYHIYVTTLQRLPSRVVTRRLRNSRAPLLRPTYSNILEQAVRVMNEDGFDRFNVQRVLEMAEVSRATLYRHFQDVDGLIEAALIETFRLELDRFLNFATDLVRQAPDLAAFRESVRTLTRAFGEVPSAFRLHRTHTIALSATRPGLAAGVATVQEMLTDGWNNTIIEAQRRGFVRADLDARAAAVMMQGMALGRIVDDAAASRISNESWAQIFFDFIDRAVLVNPK